MPYYAIDGVIPVVSSRAYVHPQAVLIGDVVIEEGVYIGPFATLRADFGGIHIQKMPMFRIPAPFMAFPVVSPWSKNMAISDMARFYMVVSFAKCIGRHEQRDSG